MSDHPSESVLRIRKYPNRRYYDTTRRCHVTLDELYHLVRGGRQIEVTDSSGADITNIVLTQIILEHDPPKLDLFPPTLLHQAIQANQQMIRRFIEDYFARAMDAFVASRQQFDEFLKRAGLSPLTPATPFDWARMFLRGFDTPSRQPSEPFVIPDAPLNETRDDHVSTADAVEALRAQVQSLREELARLKKTSRQKTRPTSPGRSKNPSKRR